MYLIKRLLTWPPHLLLSIYLNNRNGRSHTVKNQYATYQLPKDTRSIDAPKNKAHATASNDQTNLQSLNSQALYEHTVSQARLSQDPYYAHMLRQNEMRSLQNSFSSLDLNIPTDLYQNKIIGDHAYNESFGNKPGPYFITGDPQNHQNSAGTAMPTQTDSRTLSDHPVSAQTYSNVYLAPETANSYPEQTIEDNYTCNGTRDEYDINEQGVMSSSNDLNGFGGQFPVYSYRTPYTDTIYQSEVEIAEEW